MYGFQSGVNMSGNIFSDILNPTALLQSPILELNIIIDI